MKKLYSILGLCAMFALPTFAQEEEDMTSYIANPGFDEDLTWQQDGSMKEIVDKSETLSTRSQAWVAADGTCYCYADASVSGSWNATKRAGDSWATNGFVGQVQGWTLETNKSTTAPYATSSPEWVYFGTVAYGLGDKSIPIADDGNTYLIAPAKPAECDTEDNLGFAYLRAGWGGRAVYKQVVQLPCAQYRLDYWIYNANYAGSASNTSCKNLCKVTCRKDVFEDTEGFNTQEWTKHSIEFTPTSEFTIEFGFESSGSSGTNPFVCIDGIKLYKIGEADEAELLQADISEMIDSINGLVEDNLSAFGGVADEVADKMAEFEDIAYSGETEQMEQGLKDIKDYAQTVNDFVATADEFVATIEQAAELLEAENPYPGVDALSDAISAAQLVMEEGDMAQVTEGLVALNSAIDDYYKSQEATPENPADYTFLIDNPTFVAQGEWYIGQTGGDQRLHTGLTDNEGNAMTAWNAWRNNLQDSSSSVSISQDLTGLPNGIYTVTADMCTQDGCITDQHVFANGSAQSAQSPVMTLTGWNPYVWETLTTAQVIVVDGKLTIGAIGHGPAVAGDVPSNHGGSNTDARMGWFCISNFKLNYLGAATEEQYAAAIAQKFADAETFAENMHYAADKATAKAAVAEAKTSSDLDALNAALTIAEASEADYTSVITGTYKTLQDTIKSDAYSATDKKVAQVPVDYMTNYLGSAAATYTETGDITTVLRYYLNTLIPALQEAENTEIADATGKAALEGTIASVVAKLGTYESDTEVLAEYVAELNNGIAVAKKADIVYGDNTDVTAYITNPNIDAIDGWTVNKPVGDGNGRKSGQDFDGNTDSGYIDTYNGTAGNLRATIYQVLNVPNGSYKLENTMRTSGTGAYLFASDAAPVTNEEGNLVAAGNTVLAAANTPATDNIKYVDAASEEATSVYNASYGEVWCAAADTYMGLTGITGAMEGTNVYELISDKTAGEALAGYETEWAILSANSGQGYGWFNNSAEIEVTNHVLVVGVSCDYIFTGKEQFSGTWFSADNFKLTLVKAGNNAGWNPATAIEAVATETENAVATEVYSISGARSNGLKKGINIVRYANGDVKKVLVK